MDREVIKRVAKAIAVGWRREGSWEDYVFDATIAIEAYEAAKQEAQDAEDERLYTEFHK